MRSALIVAGLVFFTADVAAGQTPISVGQESPDAPVDPSIAPEAGVPLSDEELAEIEAAIQADQAESDVAEMESTDNEPESGRGARFFQSLNPDMAAILDVALAYFSDEDAQLQTGAHDPTENAFNLQQIELSLSAAVDPYFRIDSNIVFGLFGVEVEEFYATTLGIPGGIQFRLGQFLTRFGRLNATHPHSWDFVDQPFALGRIFGGEGNRGLGAEVSWLTPLPWYVELIVSATEAGGEATARSFFGPTDLGVDGVGDLQYTVAAKQFFALSDSWSLGWGLSAAFGPNATGRDNRSEVYGTDVYLKWRPLNRENPPIVSIQTEWFHRRRQIPGDVLGDFSGYAQLFYRFAARWGAALRYDFGSPARGERGNVVDDYLDPEWTTNRHRWTANLTFWPTEFSRFRLQGSVDLPEWLDEPQYALFFSAEFVAGAHGAHQF